MDSLFGVRLPGMKGKKAYALLSQGDSDDSDEDEDVFSKEQVRNGDLELKLIPNHGKKTTKAKTRSDRHDVAYRGESRSMSNCRIICICLSVVLSMTTVAILVAVFGPRYFAINPGGMWFGGNKSQPGTTNWNRVIEDIGTESCVRLVDVDGDQILDVILGTSIAVNVGHLTNYKAGERIETYCKNDLGSEYPCIGSVLALGGYDGKTLWQVPTRAGPLLMNCEHVDINKDGKPDCIISGRAGTLLSLDPKTGKVFWTIDHRNSSNFKELWNVYQVLALPDFDEDGVPELLVPQGGFPAFPPEEHDRFPGHLSLVSGATGKFLGKRYMSTPENKETYSTPVMYTAKDGSQYILFGNGGETVSGNFFALSLPDFYRYVMELDANDNVPGVTGQYNLWQTKPKDANGLITIYRDYVKGVMVPPVIIDINSDGTDDILMSAYSGHLTMLDGKNLQEMWTADFGGMESYSTPAPGYFDDDDIPDFMVHWNQGAWPKYNYSTTFVISGKDGSKLWSTNSSMMEMTSDLVLMTEEPHRSIFLFRQNGRLSKAPSDSSSLHMGLKTTGDASRKRRHIGEEENEDDNLSPKNRYLAKHVTCDGDLEPLKQEIFILDRTLLSAPIKVGEIAAYTYEYDVAEILKQNDRTNPTDNEDHSDVSHDHQPEPNLTDIINNPDVSQEVSTPSIPRVCIYGIYEQCREDEECVTKKESRSRQGLCYCKFGFSRDATGVCQAIIINPSQHTERRDVESVLGKMCVVLRPEGLATGAIGDADGDGTMDYINVTPVFAQLIDTGYGYVKMKSDLVISKFNLVEAIDARNTVSMEVHTSLQPKHEKAIEEVPIKPPKQQPWTLYLGSNTDSHYNPTD